MIVHRMRQLQRANKIPLVRGMADLSAVGGSFAKKYPMAFGMIFTGCKTALADFIVQTAVEGKNLETNNWRRTGVFGAFGFFYMGGAQYLFYVNVLGYLFPRAATFAAQPMRKKMKDFKGQAAVVGQTALEQFVHTPLCFFPAYYIFKESCLGDPKKREEAGQGIVTYALTHYMGNFKYDMFADMGIWIPSHIINFTFMPMHLRIPWVATTSFVYCMVLSYMRGGSHECNTETEDTNVENRPCVTGDASQ